MLWSVALILSIAPLSLSASQLILLENVRFYKEEEKNDAEFSKKVRSRRPGTSSVVQMLSLLLMLTPFLCCSSPSPKMAANADLYVNDAFGTAHRAHSSTEGVAKFLKPAVSGFLLQKELDYLDGEDRHWWDGQHHS